MALLFLLPSLIPVAQAETVVTRKRIGNNSEGVTYVTTGQWKNRAVARGHLLNAYPCSRGRGLNSHGQVVGGSSDCHNFLHAFLWEEGGPMLDLNTLIQPGTGYQLTNAFNINDRGEILAKTSTHNSLTAWLQSELFITK